MGLDNTMYFTANAKQFLTSDGTTTNLNNGGENVASLTSSLITLKKELSLSQTGTFSSQMTIENTSTGNAVLSLRSNLRTTQFLTDSAGAFKLTQRNISTGNVTVTGLELYPNGVLSTGNKANKKVISLYENGTVSDDPVSATNFFGFGIDSGIQRYQVPTATNSHRFFCGRTLSFTITNGTGTSGSDIRFKSEIENIDNALDVVCKLQAKKFKYMDCEGKQLGFIAQEVYELEPDLVHIDESTDDKFMFLSYDRFCALHNEAIKEQQKRIVDLETRLANIEKLLSGSMNI